jgi:hypothetical protein
MTNDNNGFMQFSLQSLMLSFIVVASALAAFGPWGIAITILILAVVAAIRRTDSTEQALFQFAWKFILFCFFIILCSFFINTAHHYDNRCIVNLNLISCLLNTYELEHDGLPRPYYLGPDGKPWHSWRIYIAPYSASLKNTSDAYNFQEPWDGPNNSKLAQAMNNIYQCPSDSSADNKSTTNYLAVVGPDTLWPGDKTISSNDIPDGADKTILLIEWPHSEINWLEPRDFTVEQLCKELESNPKRFAVHNENYGYLFLPDTGIHVLFADGKVRLLSVDYLRKNIKALLTRNGGETIEPFSRRINWPWLTSVIIFVISTIVLIVRPRQWKKQTESQANTQ